MYVELQFYLERISNRQNIVIQTWISGRYFSQKTKWSDPLTSRKTGRMCCQWCDSSFQVIYYYCFFKRFIYLFLERREVAGEREWETSMWGCLSCAPNWGPGPKPRHVPWLGIELVTVWYVGQHSIHWASPAQAMIVILK